MEVGGRRLPRSWTLAPSPCLSFCRTCFTKRPLQTIIVRCRPLICCTSLIADHTPQPVTCGRPVQTLLSATRYRTSQRPRGVTSTRLAYGIPSLLTLLHLEAAKPATDVMCCPTHDVISHDGLQIAASMRELAHWPAHWPGGVMVSKQDAAAARPVKEGQRSVGWSRITERRPGWSASP